MLVVVMIETPTGVANAYDIARVPGVDVVIIGNNDLNSFSGFPQDDPRYHAMVIKKIHDDVLRAGGNANAPPEEEGEGLRRRAPVAERVGHRASSRRYWRLIAARIRLKHMRRTLLTVIWGSASLLLALDGDVGIHDPPQSSWREGSFTLMEPAERRWFPATAGCGARGPRCRFGNWLRT